MTEANQVATRNAAAAAIEKMRQAGGLSKVKQQTHVKGGDGTLLRLLKDGRWVYGAENTEVQEGSLWAVNPVSVKHGWVAWTDYPGNRKNEAVGEVMVPSFEDKPLLTELPKVATEENGAEWVDQISFELRCMNGEDEGQVVTYKTNSHGGLTASITLCEAINKAINTGDEFCPVLELLVDSYNHPKWGQTFKPILDVRKWIGLDQTVEQAVEEVANTPPREAPAPTRQRRAPANAPGGDRGDGGPAAPKGAPVDDREARKAELRRLLAEEEGGAPAGGEAPAKAPAAEPRRRRRAAA